MNTTNPSSPTPGAFPPPSYPQGGTHTPPPKKHDDLFKEAKWRDVWAGVLYMLVLAATIGLEIWAVSTCLSKGLYDTAGEPAVASREHSASWMFEGLWIGGMMVLSIILSILSYLVISAAPQESIKVAFWANIGVEMGLGVYFLLKELYALGIICLVLGLILLIMFFFIRKRIPLTAELLRTVTSVARTYPAMFLCSFLSAAASVAYFVLLIHLGHSLSKMHNAKLLDDGAYSGLIVYAVFSFYWTQQVISNVFHTIISGVMATFYFVSGSGRPMGHPTAASAKRALTYSFGSIALGSLIVALIQTLRFILQSSTKRNSIGGAIADCLLSIVEEMTKMFNYYAYIYVAIYGEPFVASAKSTWNLIKTRGLDAIINDNLTGTCVWMFALLNAVVCTMLTYIVLALFRTYESPSQEFLVTGVVSTLVFFIALFLTSLMLNVVSSGVSATFVCLAADPGALKRTKPELYNRLEAAYSGIFRYWYV